MNEKIRLLPKSTIDKIAAGEVVERPSSVVKELTENSIDAGATAISIEIRGGGKDLIRVTDNGSGIPKEEIPTAFLRHATSKIRSAEDLDHITSLGFRGEALSSIAAVSDLTLITKTREEDFGVDYTIEGGQEAGEEEVGSPDGTTFLVENLFYNTPARRKFLKSDLTEAGKVEDLVNHLALSHPEISFHLKVNGRERLLTAGSGTLSDVVYQIYGRQVAKNLIPFEEENPYFKARGYLGAYTLNRGNRSFETFFIDKRFIESKILSEGVEEGYKGFLMQHQFPFSILFFTFPEGKVDVNVHPSKREVRLSDEREVFSALSIAVHSALTGREDIALVSPKEEEDKAPRPKETAEPFEEKHLSQVVSSIEKHTVENNPLPDPIEPRPGHSPAFAKPLTFTFLSKEEKENHRIIGQVFKTYWLVEWRGKVVIIDQHAAHEKVNFERLMKRLREKDMTSQLISPGILLDLTPEEASLCERYREEIEALGFSFSPFGGREYQVTAVPGNLYSIDPKALFTDVVSSLSSLKPSDGERLITEHIATMACKASVKGNEDLSRPEAEALIDELLSLDEPYHCPHGRPTMVSVTRQDLDKLFKRIV